MNSPDVFPYFWLALVAFIAVGNVARAINDLRVGSARFGWMSARVDRDAELFEFWMAVIGKFVGVVVAAFMFHMGLDMLHW